MTVLFAKVSGEIARGARIAFSNVRWSGLIFLLAGLDQLSKYLIVNSFELYQSSEIIPGLFNLVYVQNRGAAFGLFSSFTSPLREIVLLSATAIAMSVVLAFLGSGLGESRWGRLALALVCGGAIGNLIDRVWLGYVVDFLDFYVDQHHWPAFNLADSFICVGVAVTALLPRKAQPTAVSA